MTKILSFIAVLVLSALVLSAVTTTKVHAFDVFDNTCQRSNFQGTDVCKEVSSENNKISSGSSTADPVKHVIAIVIDIISYVVGALAVIFILVSAIRFLTSGGDTNSISEARSGIIYAIVGIIVVVLAQSFVDFILGKL